MSATDEHLIYLFDPLCGWCYGASPKLDTLAEGAAAVELLPTGLFSNTGRKVDADFAAYAWSNDQRIAQMTGVTFSEAYRRDVLDAGGDFDSALATLAVVAAGSPTSDERRRALKALQQGRYVAGRSLTDMDSVTAILTEAGLPEAAELLRDLPDALVDRTREEVIRGQELMQALGARGVPTLAARRGEAVAALSSERLFH